MRWGLRSVFWRAMNASVRRSRCGSGERVGHSQTGKQVSDLAASQAMVGVRQHGSDFPSTPWGPPPGRLGVLLFISTACAVFDLLATWVL